MLLTYCEEDALKWAAFSGDYNPIHFVAERAKALGMDSMTVHGMRAMHDMKNHLHMMHSHNDEHGDYYRFSARLRQSVNYHVPHKLTGSPEKNSRNISSQLINTLTDELCFSATLSCGPARQASTIAPMQCISGQEYRALYQEFSDSINDESCQWIFTDALLFRCIAHSKDVLHTVGEMLPDLKAKTLNEVFEHVPVIQSHHEVHFNASYRQLMSKETPDQDFLFSFLPTLVLGDREKGFIIRVSCQGGFHAENLLTTSLTLKTWPVMPFKTSENRN